MDAGKEDGRNDNWIDSISGITVGLLAVGWVVVAHVLVRKWYPDIQLTFHNLSAFVIGLAVALVLGVVGCAVGLKGSREVRIVGVLVAVVSFYEAYLICVQLEAFWATTFNSINAISEGDVCNLALVFTSGAAVALVIAKKFKASRSQSDPV